MIHQVLEHVVPEDFSEFSQQILLVLRQVSLGSQGTDDPGISLQLWEQKHTSLMCVYVQLFMIRNRTQI